MINLSSIDAFAIRVPIEKPIKVAFGTFRDRPLVMVRVTDSEGATGWGEIWSNWPAVGAEHRARLAVNLGQALLGRDFASPADVYHAFTAMTEVLAIQTGEIGPIAQVIAGIDIAVWDLASRKRNVPLSRMLSDAPLTRVPVYASGINPDRPGIYAAARRAEGHRAFKLKIGFGTQLDLRNIAALREAVGAQDEVMIDANQSLDRQGALTIMEQAKPHALGWFEEPIRADAPLADWQALAQASIIPIAGGENLRGAQFADWIARGDMTVFQPDISKWGGVTGCLEVGNAAVAQGHRYCPHVFGGGIASLASLHTLAAVKGTGALETDQHPNAGRELILGDLLPVENGSVAVPQGPGLGCEVDIGAFSSYITWASE